MDFGIRQVRVGGLTRAQLEQQLAQAGTQFNDYAKVLLAHRIFDDAAPARTLNLVSRNLQDLGLSAGLNASTNL